MWTIAIFGTSQILARTPFSYLSPIFSQIRHRFSPSSTSSRCSYSLSRCTCSFTFTAPSLSRYRFLSHLYHHLPPRHSLFFLLSLSPQPSSLCQGTPTNRSPTLLTSDSVLTSLRSKNPLRSIVQRWLGMMIALTFFQKIIKTLSLEAFSSFESLSALMSSTVALHCSK
jgi:hypothetical protein